MPSVSGKNLFSHGRSRIAREIHHKFLFNQMRALCQNSICYGTSRHTIHISYLLVTYQNTAQLKISHKNYILEKGMYKTLNNKITYINLCLLEKHTYKIQNVN